MAINSEQSIIRPVKKVPLKQLEAETLKQGVAENDFSWNAWTAALHNYNYFVTIKTNLLQTTSKAPCAARAFASLPMSKIYIYIYFLVGGYKIVYK